MCALQLVRELSPVWPGNKVTSEEELPSRKVFKSEAAGFEVSAGYNMRACSSPASEAFVFSGLSWKGLGLSGPCSMQVVWP